MRATKGVRKYFNIQKRKATCLLCHHVYQFSGNTTNMWKHIAAKHKAENKALIKSNHSANQSTTIDLTEPSAITKDSHPSSCSSTSHSANSVPKENNNIRSTGSTITKSCPDLLTLDMMVANKNALKEGGSRAIQLNNSLLYMICVDNLPLSTPEKRGFQHFMKCCNPLWKPPSRRTITRDLDEKYEELRNAMREKLESCEYVNLTFDNWTETHATRSYLGATVHFKEGIELKTVVLGVDVMDHQHTSEYLQEKMKECIQYWCIDINKVTLVVTDNAPNIVSAAKAVFGPQKHMGCFAHLLNLIPAAVYASRTKDKIPNVRGVPEVLAKVKAIVSASHHSYNFSDAIRSEQQGEGVTELRLVQEVPTRWNSAYLMCLRFLELKEKVAIAAMKTPGIIMPTPEEIETLECLRDILRPFNDATQYLSAQKQCTLSIVIPMIKMLKENVQNTKLPRENPIAKKIQTFLLTEIEKRFGAIEKNMICTASTLLDPRFLKMHIQSIVAVSSTLTMIEKEIVKIRKKEELLSETEPLIQPSPTKEGAMTEKNSSSEIVESEHNFWCSHDTQYTQITANKLEDHSAAARAEINSFFARFPTRRESNPLQTWEELKSNFPYLYKVAKIFLPCVATSVPCERLFSLAALIMDENGNRLSPEHLKRRIFLAALEHHYWFDQ